MTRLLVRKKGDRWVYVCGLHFSGPRKGLDSWSFERALNAALQHWEVRHADLIGNVCPRCANGLPTCHQLRPDGKRWDHEDTCAKYDWADDVCEACDRARLLDEERP